MKNDKEIKSILDELFIHIETIEDLNSLIYDKLDDIDIISKKTNQTLEQKALDFYEIERNISNYLTLNLIISKEVEAMSDKVKTIYDELNARITPEKRKEE